MGGHWALVIVCESNVELWGLSDEVGLKWGRVAEFSDEGRFCVTSDPKNIRVRVISRRDFLPVLYSVV